MTTKSPLTPDYVSFVNDLKARISSAHLSAARAVNRELILLYWEIGRGIVEKQRALGWDESVVEMLAKDLRDAFPDMRGFSARNLWYVRRFFSAYADPQILQQLAAEFSRKPAEALSLAGVLPKLQQLAAEIPWGHHMVLMNRLPAEFKGKLPTAKQLAEVVREVLPAPTKT